MHSFITQNKYMKTGTMIIHKTTRSQKVNNKSLPDNEENNNK